MPKQPIFFKVPKAILSDDLEFAEFKGRVIRQTASRIGVENCEFFEPTIELLPMIAKKDYSVSQYLVDFISIKADYFKVRKDLRVSAEAGTPTKRTQEKLKRLLEKRDIARDSLVRYLDNKYP